MRGPLSSLNFTIPVLVALAITTAFAIVLNASLELVGSMLLFGVVAAVIEYRAPARSSSLPRRIDAGISGERTLDGDFYEGKQEM